LEDLLNVAKDRDTRRTSAPAPQQQRPAPQYPSGTPRRSGQESPQRPRFEPADERAESRPFEPFPSQPQRPHGEMSDEQRRNEQAIVLVRAMLNAAKSDGQLSQDEQQSILSRLSDTSPDTLQFLREEFARPLDVRQFAWSVPLGMEQQVYLMSLTAIDVDTNAEVDYLRELAHGLRLSPEMCEQIHQSVGARSIF
jgi:uncharacterized membrane protein YebE (DUF533 family)